MSTLPQVYLGDELEDWPTFEDYMHITPWTCLILNDGNGFTNVELVLLEDGDFIG
jgi:hypothetical protein